MIKEEEKKRRYFGGLLRVYINKQDKEIPVKVQEYKTRRNFESKHLKSYLKGDKMFSFGRDIRGFPIWYNVVERWK